MIIGPASGGFVYATYGIVGLAILVASFIAIAIVGTYFMSEPRTREAATAEELPSSKS
jgi:hypothetical protein